MQDVPYGLLQHGQLVLRLRGENDPFFVDLLGALGNVQRMVADALKVGNGVQIFGYLFALAGVQRLDGDLHEVGAQLVLKAVNGLLLLLDMLEGLVAVCADQPQRIHQIAAGGVGHGGRDLAALFNGQRGMLQKALLQPIHFQLCGVGAAPVGDEEADKALQQADKRRQHHHGGQAEQGVQQCNGHRGHGLRHKRKMYESVHRIEHRSPDNNAQNVNQQVDECGAAAVDVGAQRAEQNGHGCADGDAHDDGEGHLKGDGAGNGQRLQNAHGGRSALKNAGEGNAHQNAQKGI